MKVVVAVVAVLLVAGAGGVAFYLRSGKGKALTLPKAIGAKPAVKKTVSKAEIKRLIEQDKFEKAVGLLETFLKEHPGDVEAKELLASAYVITGDPGNATKLYREILETNPRDAETLYRLGMLYQQSGTLGEAVKYLRQASDNEPTVLLYVSELAKALARADRVPEAINQWNKALTLLSATDVYRASVYAEIADLYLRQNQPAQAATAIASGLRIEPGNERLKSLQAKAQIPARPAVSQP